MEKFEVELVGKIGSMALICKQDNDIDYNIFRRLSVQFKPGMIWVSSGATEIGRLDYMKRNGGAELTGDIEEVKADYAAQGQSILMETYRQFIPHKYSVRQVLVEHQHFNSPEKREHIRSMLLRATRQRAIPIVNYNDPVSSEENRKLELDTLRSNGGGEVVECIDNDETAAVIAELVHSRLLLIMTSVDGIFRDPSDPKSLVREVTGSDPDELESEIRRLQDCCNGASRKGSGGARAKLEYVIPVAKNGTTVIIGNAHYTIDDLVNGRVPQTRIGIR